jgi:hypothetical protein
MKLRGSNYENITHSRMVEVSDEDINKFLPLFSIEKNNRGIQLSFTVRRDFKIVKNGSCLILLTKNAEVYDFEEEIKLGDNSQ